MLQIIGAATILAVGIYIGWMLHENKMKKEVIKNLTKAYEEKYGKSKIIQKRNNVYPLTPKVKK